MLMADLAWENGDDVTASPRQILRRQLARLAERGLARLRRHRAGVRGLRRQLRGRLAARLPRHVPRQPLQRRLLPPRHGPHRAPAAPDQARHGGRGAVRRVRQGRVQPRPARDRLPLRRGAGDLRQPLHLQERRQGDRGPGGQVDHLHGQAERARGQLLPHPHLAAERGRRAGHGGRRAARAVRARRRASSPGSSPACASSPSSTPRTSTPTSGTSPAASPPPRSSGAWTTAPARCAWSATGSRCGSRTGCRAAT